MRRFVVLAAMAALAFAGCGGDDSSDATPARTEPRPRPPTEAPTEAAGRGVGVEAGDRRRPGRSEEVHRDRADAPTAGQVEVDFANESQLPHAVEIEGNGVEETTETVTGEDAPPLTVDLKPGDLQVSTARSATTAPRAWKAS